MSCAIFMDVISDIMNVQQVKQKVDSFDMVAKKHDCEFCHVDYVWTLWMCLAFVEME